MTYPKIVIRHCSRCKESGTEHMIRQVGDEVLCDQCIKDMSKEQCTDCQQTDKDIWGLE